METIHLLDLPYSEAVDVLKNIDEYGNNAEKALAELSGAENE